MVIFGSETHLVGRSAKAAQFDLQKSKNDKTLVGPKSILRFRPLKI